MRGASPDRGPGEIPLAIPLLSASLGVSLGALFGTPAGPSGTPRDQEAAADSAMVGTGALSGRLQCRRLLLFTGNPGLAHQRIRRMTWQHDMTPLLKPNLN